MMKKYIRILWLLGILLSLYIVPSAGEQVTGRKLTLMVYMCGSNLERIGGSATADIQEMMDAAPSGGEVSVLVMTGGTDADGSSGYFQSDAVRIHEIAAGKIRRVWQSDEPLSMGARDTLLAFLKYGTRYYPAREYALIVWDHGGGPLGGICWDEMYEMDKLSLHELTGALDSWNIPKLKWIGFDACLMCSAEVAAALAPYAGYMIASEETEPASGWDYSFLREIGNDEDAEATGRRIIDSYFASLADSGDTLTLSCINLEAAAELAARMDGLFSGIAEQLDEEAFRRMSVQRMESVSFGKGQHDAGVEGYDLVDLASLLAHYQIRDEEITQALEKAVVCSCSNKEGVSGLSVYHPYSNKNQYSDAWRTGYRKLHFCDGYTRYAEAFGSYLLEETGTDWSGLVTEQTETGEDEAQRFQLQLSPEQQADFVSAQLLILEDCSDPSLDERVKLSPVFAVNAEMNGDGLLAAEYSNQMIYVVDEENSVLLGPVCFHLDAAEDEICIYSRFINLIGDEKSKPAVTVLLYCENPGDEPQDLEIRRKNVYDSTVGKYTNRLRFSEQDYEMVLFYTAPRALPDTAGTIPDFTLWEEITGPVSGISAEGWHLRLLNDRQPEKLYAMFQVTDSRQNVYSSIPVPVANHAEKHYSFTPDGMETKEFSFTVDASLNMDTVWPRFRLQFDFENKTDHTLRIRMDRIVFNNEISLNSSAAGLLDLFLDPGSSLTKEIELDSDDLMGVNELRQFDAIVEVTDWTDYGKDPARYELHMATDGCDLSQFASPRPEVLSEYEENGIVWQLLSLAPDSGDTLKGLVYVQNNTDEEFCSEGTICLNELQTDTDMELCIQPHTGCYETFSVSLYDFIIVSILKFSGRNELVTKTVENIPELLGIREIDCVRYYEKPESGRAGTGPVTFNLSKPLQLPGDGKSTPETKPLLAGDIAADLAGVVVADDGIAVTMVFQNNTDAEVRLFAETLYLNDLAAEGSIFAALPESFLPGMKAVSTVILRCDEVMRKKTALALKEASFCFRKENETTTTARILFPDQTFFGTDGGIWLPAEQLETVCAEWENLPMLISEEIIIPDDLPEEIALVAPDQPWDEFRRFHTIHAVVCTALQDESPSGPDAENGPARLYPIIEYNMDYNTASKFHAVFPGLALRINNQPVFVEMEKNADGTWRMKADYSLFFYENPEDFIPSGESQIHLNYSKMAKIDITLDLLDSSVRVKENNTVVRNRSGWNRERTNYPLSDASLAAVERTIFDWSKRSGFVNYDSFYEQVPLSLENSLQMELVPLSELEGKLYIVYYIWLEEKGDTGMLIRKDLLVDWDTGEIIRSSPAR